MQEVIYMADEDAPGQAKCIDGQNKPKCTKRPACANDAGREPSTLFGKRLGAAHGIWLNLGQNLFPSLTPDTFAFAGSFDRYVVAVPSRDVVIVRFGFSAQPGDFDMERFVANVLELVPY